MRAKNFFEFNFWFGVADVILAISMIFLLLWVVERFQTNALKTEIKLLNVQVSRLSEEVTSLRKDKPPIIRLDEASGYSFDTGSAVLSMSFQDKLLQKIIPDLNKTLEEYDVNVIEVIGHTDGQIVSGKQSNLDDELEEVVLSQQGIENLMYGSNVDLGLIRAIAVAQYIQANSAGKLLGVKYRFYSAAQLIPPDGDLQSADRGSNEQRRRIELRFTKLGK